MSKRRRHTPDQIIRKLAEGNKLLAGGTELDEVCRHLQIAESTWHRWVAQHGGIWLVRPPSTDAASPSRGLSPAPGTRPNGCWALVVSEGETPPAPDERLEADSLWDRCDGHVLVEELATEALGTLE